MRWVWINPKYAGLIAAMRLAEKSGAGPWRSRSFIFPPTN